MCVLYLCVREMGGKDVESLENELEKASVEEWEMSVFRYLCKMKDVMKMSAFTEALIDPTSASTASLTETDDYLFLDPRARSGPAGPGSGGEGGEQKALGMTSRDVFVVIAGAGYLEYGKLGKWAGKTGRRIAYGGTKILDPGTSLDMLGKIGVV